MDSVNSQTDVLLTVIIIELALLLGGLYVAAQKAQAAVSSTGSVVSEVAGALEAIV